jgi:hypothetical protein
VRGVAITLACFAVIAVLLAWSRWIARQRLASLGHLALAGACAVVAAVLWVVTDDLAGFDPVRPGAAIAELHFDATAPGSYRATLIRLPMGGVQVFAMPGERWRIEARTLEWIGPASSLGSRPVYRLQQLESGPSAAGTAAAATGRRYALTDVVGVDVWARVRSSTLWSRYARAGVVEAPWQPMTAGAEFTVTIAGDRLVIERTDASDRVLAPLTP